jgi:hypothetical protein
MKMDNTNPVHRYLGAKPTADDIRLVELYQSLSPETREKIDAYALILKDANRHRLGDKGSFQAVMKTFMFIARKIPRESLREEGR